MTAVVLAAGAGTRMGSPKLLLPLDGKPLLAHVLDLVDRLPVDGRVLVLGAEADAIRTALFSPPSRLGSFAPSLRWEGVGGRVGEAPSPRPSPTEGRGGLEVRWRVVVNEGWREGMGSSLRRAAEEADDGLLVFLGDMPWVPEGAARAVLARAGDRPVAPAHRGRRGFPVYLPRALRPALLALRGDQGARDLLGNCELIPWPDDGVVRDVDREEDLRA